MIVILANFDDTRWLAILFSADNSPLVAAQEEDVKAEQRDDQPTLSEETD